MAYKHIGVAISGNEEDALLVNKALELARHNDAHLTLIHIDDGLSEGNDSNLLIVFYVQIMPDDFVMQLHRF